MQAVIGEWCSSASIAAAQVAGDAKVPMIVQISTADGIAKSAGPYVFQSIMPNSAIQEREGKLLLEKFTFKTAAILVENNDFGLSFRANMRKTLEQAGVRIVLDIPQDRQDANWYSTITRIKGAAPDMVVMSISAGQAANFVKQYAESNVKTLLFSDYTPPPYIFEGQVGPAGRPHRSGARRLFREQPRRHAAPAGLRRPLRAGGREGPRRKTACRALGHRDLRCGPDRGRCIEARRFRRYRRSAERDRCHEIRRRSRHLRVRRRSHA